MLRLSQAYRLLSVKEVCAYGRSGICVMTKRNAQMADKSTIGSYGTKATHRRLLEQLARVGGLTLSLVLFSECGADVELLCRHLGQLL